MPLKVGIPSCLMPHNYVNIHGKGVGCVCRLSNFLTMHRGCTAEGSVVYRDIILTCRSSFLFTFGRLAPGTLSRMSEVSNGKIRHCLEYSIAVVCNVIACKPACPHQTKDGEKSLVIKEVRCGGVKNNNARIRRQ